MEPTLTWIDLTTADRDKMRRVLDLFNEQGTIDEMGLGTLRDALSDALFPGTSSIQTRLRYMLFIPWIYQRLEKKAGQLTDVATVARKEEIGLIQPLKDSGEVQGVIGAVAGARLSRLPSHAYWAGLVRWGIFQHPRSQSWYHRYFADLARRDDGIMRADDPGLVWTRKGNWHPRLPPVPEGFPDEVSFDSEAGGCGLSTGMYRAALRRYAAGMAVAGRPGCAGEPLLG